MKQKSKNKFNIAYKKIEVITLSFVLILAYAISSFFSGGIQTAEATVPLVMNFQGKLTKVSDGTNVSNASYAFRFKLYDAVTSGTLLWTETYDQPSGSCAKLAVTNGVFNSKLGSCASLSSVDFSGGSVYLSVDYAPTGTSYDGEMSPRKQLLSSAFAILANGVNGNGGVRNTISSTTALAIAKAGTDYALQVDTSAGSAVTGLKVTSAAAAGGLDLSTLSTGANEALTINAKGSGLVSIGTTSTGGVSLGHTTTGDILFGGGVGSTGCTVTNSTGAFACTAGLTGVGVNASTGLLQGQLGLTVTGATASINASSNFATNINTGTSTGTITLGGTAGNTINIGSDNTVADTITLGSALDSLAISSTAFKVNTSGAITGATGLVSSGTIQFSSLTTNGALYTSAGNGTLTTTAPTSGALGYWSRSTTILDTATAGDLIRGTGGLTITGAAVSLNSSSNFGVDIAAGTSTGTITLGGTGASQSIQIGTGVAAKTIAIGNSTDDTFSINSSAFTVSTTGAVTGVTTLSASNQITSTLSTGTAPFVVASTTNVANLNASSLNGATFAAPGSIGSGTPGSGAFTTLTSSGSTTIGTGSSLTNTFGSGASSINTIGAGTTPGTLTLLGSTIVAGSANTTAFTLGNVTTNPTLSLLGTGLTTLGGNLTVTGTSWTATPTISGLITATSGLTSNGTLTVSGGQNLTMASGSGVFAQTSTATTASPQTLSATALTTGVAQALTLGSALTTGGAYSVASASYNHGAAETGSLASYSFSDVTSGAFASTTNGALISPTINITAGAATKTINAVSINPTFTACTTATCNVQGLNIANVTDSGNFTSSAVKFGTGWDTLISGTTAGTNLIDFTNFKVTTAGVMSALTGLSSSGTIQFSSLTTNGALYTSAGNGTLTTTAPTSGALGYWQRNSGGCASATTICPATANDIISQATTNTTGADLAITNTGVYTGTGILNLTANSLTSGVAQLISTTGLSSGSALKITGTTGASGATGAVASLTSNIGATGSLISGVATIKTNSVTSAYNLNLSTTNSNTISANSVFGIENVINDAVALDNTVYGSHTTINLSGNANKTGYGQNTYVNSSSTTADSLYGGYFYSAETGAVTTGTQNVYGVYGTAGSANVNGGTTNIYGLYSWVDGTVTSGTVNNYGVYVKNGTSNTTGTSTKYGLYIENQTGADTNYAAIFAGGNVGIGTTAPAKNLEINNAAGGTLRLTYNATANLADLSVDSGGNLTLDSSSNRTIIATGDFLKTSVSGVSGAAAGDIWYDTAALKYKINENGTTKILCNTTDAGCGAGGGTTWDTIGDAAGNGAVNMGTTVQTLDWGATTTTDNLSVTSSATGLTSGSAFKVTSATTGAISAGIVQLIASANYTSSSSAGLLSVLANSTTAGTIAKFSGTSLTTGTNVALLGGTAMTTGSVLGVSSTTYNHGNATETGNLLSLAFTDATNGTATSTTNGINLTPTINVTTGASGVKTINGIKLTAPTLTACTGGSTCTYAGINVDTSGTLANTTIYSALFNGGNVGIGDTTPNSLFTVGSGDLFQINSTGQIGSQQAPVSDYLFALAGTTGNDHSRIIDITQANNTTEDSQVINIVNTANLGTVQDTALSVKNMYSELDPIASVSSPSVPTELNIYGNDQIVNVGSVSLGNTSFLTTETLAVYGNSSTVSFAPTINDTTGSGSVVLNGYGNYGLIGGSPTYTAVASTAVVSSYGGYFENSVSTSNANTTITATGVAGISNSGLTTTGVTSHYGGNFIAGGTADVNYGIYANVSGATANYAAILTGGNVGIGTTAPDKALEINSATGGNLRLTYNDSDGSAANYGDLTVTSGGDLTLNSSSNRTIIATGDFLKTSVSGVSGAAAGDIWYDTAALKYKINENGTTKTLCNTTDAGCGSGGSTAFDVIADPSGNGAINMGTTVQTLDWGATTTTDNLSVTSSGTGLTSGSAFKVTSATTGAVTNGIVQLTASAAYTGAGGLLNVTANSTATGNVAKFSGTGLTTGNVLQIVGGTAMTTGSDLEINGATYVHTGSETGSLADFIFTDATISAVTSTTNGISIAPTINAPSGAATRTINGLTVTPTFTSCAAGTCTVNGVNIGNVVDGTGFTSTAVNIGSGWDTGLKFVETNTGNGTDTVTISAPASITASYNWTLPSADSAGCIQSNGSGTLSIATCGDTNNQSFSNAGAGNYSLPTGALMVIVETFGSGGGGGGGAGSANVTASRSGGGGGGGGSYITSTFSASTLGTPGSTTVPVTVAAGGTGGGGGNNAAGTRGNPGNPSCFATGANCTGTVYVRAFGGGGGGPGSITANTGAGGGGGGGSEAVGTNSTAGAGGVGGAPQGSAVTTANSGAGGGGGATSANAATAGGAAHFGGAGGGASSLNGSATGGAGGGSVIGGSGGGSGGGSPITTCALKAGGNGGSGQAISGSGALGGTTTGAAGANGATGVGGGGDGGGGGANGCATTGGAGGIGGLKGGGGGGGGYGNAIGGAGGNGGIGYVRVWTYKGQGADLAEIYGTNDSSLTAGDVVAIDSTMRAGVKKTTKSYDNTTIGVISTSPGLVIGNVEDPGATPVMVALSGRVPVKVNMENGAIHKGDYLTPSSIPGEAMKSVKAGLIIGQSMTEYTDSTAPGIVVAFIKSGPSNGSKLGDILPDGLVGGSANPETPEKTIQQRALAYLNTGRGILETSVDISEIFTDRLTAGLEVITPQLYANNVNIDNIHSMNGDNVGLILNSGGKFTIGGETIVTNADGSKTTTPTDPVITFDAQGNASFAGEITAEAIIANKINGIEHLSERLVALETQAMTFATTTSLTTATEASAAQQTAQQVLLDALTTRVTTLENPTSVDLNNQNIAGSLSVNGSTTALAGLVTNNISALGGLINLMNDVEFFGRPYFNTDTAGFALIRSGERSINVIFDQEYLEQPIVSATITVEDDPRLKTETSQTNIDAINLLKEVNIQNMFNADIRFLVVNKSEQGFTIILKDPAQEDVVFSWIALQVKSAKTFSSLIIPTPPPVPQVAGDTTPPVGTTPTDTTPTDTTPTDTTPTDATPSSADTTPPKDTTPVPPASDPELIGPPSPPPTPATQ